MAKKAVTSEKIALPVVRWSFGALDKPTAFKEDQEKKFKGTSLLDPSNALHIPAIKLIKSEAKRIATEFWGEGNIPKSLEFCFGNGNDLDKVYDGYKDMFYITANSRDRVPVVGRRKNSDGKFTPVQAGDAEFPFNGCYVNTKITLWTQDSHGRKAINGNLIAVQFVKAGEAFGRPPADPDAEFEALEDGTDGASDDTSMFD